MRPSRVYGGDGAVRVRDGADRHRDADQGDLRRDLPRRRSRRTSPTASRCKGIRFAGRATGRSRMEWPLGRFSAGVRGGGRSSSCSRPRASSVLGRFAPSELTSEEERLGKVWGPFAARLPIAHVPIGADAHLHFRSRLGEDRRQPLRDAQDLRRVRGPHRVGRAVDDPLSRDQRRLARERSPAGRHHDGVRIRHRRRGCRRLGRVRRRDDQGVPCAAGRRAFQRRAHARVGRRVGRWRR